MAVKHSLVPLYQEMHAGGAYPGGYALKFYTAQIAKIAAEHGTRTILDYGCGKGHQYSTKELHKAWGIMPTLYDPAVFAFSQKPSGTFDGVICTDVLEHVPEDELDEVVAELTSYARQWCFISVCCRPATRKLPDGRNAHVTVREPEWWEAKLRPLFGVALYLEFTP